MNEWMNEWMKEWMNEWMKEWMNERIYKWKNGWMNMLFFITTIHICDRPTIQILVLINQEQDLWDFT